MYQAFLIKYAEIGIKGKNRHLFEDALVHHIVRALRDVDGKFIVTREMGRIYVRTEGEFDYDGAIEAMQTVFGIAGICPVVILEDLDVENLKKEVVKYVKEVYPEGKERTFKIFARRSNKRYPRDSMQLNAVLGEAVLEACPWMTVDVHDPDVILTTEVRDLIYIYSETIPGPGGMPVGTNGSAMLLLSGGIDSPVAGYMISKRGVQIDAVYFHAPPYTSERAKQKVVDLAKLVSKYSGQIRLHVVNFTDIQLAIYEKCPHAELTIIMRRYMMRIAEEFAKMDGSNGLITGESIGQVASQTIQSLMCTNAVCTMPVFRPLIGFDKQEIVDISQKIGTFETSIQPFEDCCTIFVAKHPVTHPILKVIERSEHLLDGIVEPMVQTAIDTAETILIGEL
ncbi:MAG: tRNA uracil 4-sulfurtransferase ThiI [Eubacterium sp.]|nr:tRNA uracil 4-sulfurtransferase ThiI [Eubacterium sp.]